MKSLKELVIGYLGSDKESRKFQCLLDLDSIISIEVDRPHIAEGLSVMFQRKQYYIVDLSTLERLIPHRISGLEPFHIVFILYDHARTVAQCSRPGPGYFVESRIKICIHRQQITVRIQ